MTKECNHEWDKRHPRFVQCMLCEKTVPIVYMKDMSEKEFREMYTQSPECGQIIIDDQLIR